VSVAPIVTDKDGRYVSGLKREQFSIFDEGVRQEIETFDSSDSALAAILVFDISGSMLVKMPDARHAAHRFLDALKPDDEVALYTFNSTLVDATDFTRDRAALHRAIDDARPNGETALYDATAAALKKLRPLKKRKAVVIFTDGEDNRSHLSVRQVVDMARASEVSIYAVAQGVDESKVLRVFLDRMAGETGGRSYFIGAIRNLPGVFQDIVTELKSQYFLTYTPTAHLVPHTWRKIEVKVNRQELTVRARKEYYVD
jgi:Ca-activated chloride channel homolog